ncbi:MAG: O-antigen ligase family protein [Candidatus Omnitrophica bacterium]|nr:O-antigen ligase family protein [Candidatus Omnitrophota bacterium]
MMCTRDKVLDSRYERLMSHTNGNINFGIILFLLFLALIIVVYNVHSMLSLMPFLFLLAPIFFIIAFTNTDFALFLLIFFMLLSPEFSVGGVRGRSVVLRADDVMLFVVFLGWMARMAVNKELGVTKVTPLNQPIVIYVFICIISTLFGILLGTVRWKESIFYVLKYCEYFLLYFMVVNILKDRKQIKSFVYAMLGVGLVISIYAWFMHFSGAERVTAPFEGKSGEPNTLGGYLTLMMMVTTGIILNSSSFREKLILSLGMCVSFPALLFTLSRSSWFGFIPAYLVLMFLSRRGKQMLLIVSLLFIMLFSVIFPKYVYQRISYTFSDQTKRTVLGKKITMDESAAARVDTWKDSIRHWARSPILGNGAGSAGSVVDNQYMRVLIEVGIVGTVAFFLLLLAITRSAFKSLSELREDNFGHGLTAGFIAGFVSLLVHSFAAATFILIRIMEPFWFLLAIVVMLPEINREEKMLQA